MNSLDLIRMGFNNLWRRKLRTFLTVLGVIIGTSSIVVMLSLGFGMQEAFESQLSQMGDLTIINVRKMYGGSMGMGSSPTGQGNREAKLDDTAIMNFKNIPHTIAVTPIVETYGMIKSGRYVAHASIRGIEPEAMEHLGYTISEGRPLKPGDDLSMVFGGGMKLQFFNEKSSRMRMGQEPDIDLMNDRMTFTFDTSVGISSPMPGQNIETPNYTDYRIKTVGVLEEGDWETDYSVYAPISTVQRMIKGKERAEDNNQRGQSRQDEYERIMVKVDNVDNVQDVQQIIQDEGFDAYSLSDNLEALNQVSNVIQAVLGGIGAIALLVAAIGITNTMVMSIYERTKEIGVMKVIGASLKDIKKLFLFESALIGFLGGLIGLSFSYLLSFLLNKFGANFMGSMVMGSDASTNISIIPIWLVFAALGFSAFIGIVSGYYPARRAMNLSALDAIRTE